MSQKFIRFMNAEAAPPPRREPRKAKPVQHEVEEPEMLPKPEKNDPTS